MHSQKKRLTLVYIIASVRFLSILITPPLAMHFYKTLLLPHMDYASEIWYSERIGRNLETFELRYFPLAP